MTFLAARIALAAGLCVGVGGVVGLSPAWAAEDKAVSGPRTVVGASSNNFPPINVLDENGRLTGFGSELAKAVTAAAGGRLRQKHSAHWTEVLKWLDSGVADFIHDTGYTRERTAYLDYTDPIIEMPERIFVNAERYDIQNIMSLKGKKVACVDQHITHLYLRQLPHITCHIVKRPVDGLFALLNGEVDAFIYPKQIVLFLAHNLKVRDRIRMVGEPLRTLTWHMTVKKGNAEMLAFLNRGLAKVRASGAYDRIYQRWFGEPLFAGFSKREVQLFVVAAVVISLIAVGTIFLLFYAHQMRQSRNEILASAEERERAQQALGESEERFRQMAENIGEVFWMTDPAKKEMLYVSPAYEDIWGRTRESLYERPQSFIEAIHADDRAAVTQAFAQQAAGTYDEIYRITRPDGSMRWIRDRAFPVRDDHGEIYRIVGIAEDITKSRNAELATLESKQRYENIFNGTEVCIWDEDFTWIREELDRIRADGVHYLRAHLGENPDLVQRLVKRRWVNDVNKATLRLFGAGSKQEMLESIDKTYVPASLETFIDELCAIWDGRDLFQGECPMLTLDGKELRVIVSMPIPKTPEEFRHIPVSILDITELKMLEEQLHHARKLEVVGQLTGGIAHDFNNLLTIISGNLELSRAASGDDPKLSDRLDRAFAATRRGASLTHRLLAFSRRQELRAKRVDLNQLVANLTDMLQRTLGETIKIETRYTEEPCLCAVDPAQLENVLINLAVNARDASPGGGTLTIASKNVTLDEHGAAAAEIAPGDYVELTVTDTGTGMPPDVLEHAFEPFFTTKEVGHGSGLGLSTAYGFAKQSGGHMAIASAVGQGTTVRILLPQAGKSDPDAESSADQPQASAVGGNETILVVEDDDDVRFTVVEQLNSLGYRTVAASDGKSGLDLLNREPDIDLLLTDMVLPSGMTGAELARRARVSRDALKVIFMTGYSEAEIISSIDGDIGDNLIWKPFNKNDIARLIRSALAA